MKKILKVLIKNLVIQVLSMGIILGMIAFAAWVDVPTRTDGTLITKDLWNELVAKINLLGGQVDSITSTNIPVGTILAWHKNMIGVPSLPAGWVECNGSVINDASSPLNGQATPNLNNQVYYGGKGYYLRGGNTSGLFNGSTAYDDNGAARTASNGIRYGSSFGGFHDTEYTSSLLTNYSNSPLNETNYRFQVAAMTVVYIIKIK